MSTLERCCFVPRVKAGVGMAFAALLWLMLAGCSSGMSAQWVAVDSAVAEEIGRSREVVDLAGTLRRSAEQSGRSERWSGIARQSAQLAEAASTLSMERAQVVTSSQSAQDRFYGGVLPRLRSLADQRKALLGDIVNELELRP